MLQNLKPILTALKAVDQKAVTARLTELETLTTPGPHYDPAVDVAWQAVTSYLADHGIDGIALLQKQIEDLIEGRRKDLNFSDLRASGMLVRMLQDEETDRKSAIMDAIKMVIDTLLQVAVAVVRAGT